ncbi:hypothetical protein SeMB42_g07065 [Synchytrium endobioticum]|uniref:Uncharacterized protein n=1 Tax=Synchytrium endobioticum TaxID=286115 RepID=A0A507CUG5_9FUNG|nr:hypothetical protein SeMB42_g07065 [Synchytrium endobioticum]TPX42804.1 hypothetical protein SeLEV6574_g05395 [Synchytrium endobioticum]
MLTSLILGCVLVHDAYGDHCFQNRTTCGAGGPTKELAVTDMQHFCLFLPPVEGQTIVDSEGCCEGVSSPGCTRAKTNCVPVSTDAVAFCTSAGYTNGARAFPPNLFVSGHLVRDTANKKIQITGKLTPGVWLKPGDDGGQFDFTGTGQYQVNSPPGGKPIGGYSEYLSIIGSNEYCIQMCSSHYGCNSDNDFQGCQVAIPGDYESPGFTEAEGTIYRQNSPEPGHPEEKPKKQVGPPKISQGPSSVPSPGSIQGKRVSPPVVTNEPSRKVLDVFVR